MSQFDGVTVIREANFYFEGKVSSRTVVFADGSKKTLGVMLPGEYTFNTSSHETMEILAGELDVVLPGADSAVPVIGGETFEVAADMSFTVTVKAVTDYCCSYS
ncbi:MAG: pyrimidine/purine nucleoside phosphorylase [Candidatus Fermentibacteraceae bacterium]|nr:pyrimidine/purine nucleoside phosphorylase [Candidatus Fermentibacteraceae bacterium]